MSWSTEEMARKWAEQGFVITDENIEMCRSLFLKALDVAEGARLLLDETREQYPDQTEAKAQVTKALDEFDGFVHDEIEPIFEVRPVREDG